MKKDLTGESIHLVNDETPEEEIHGKSDAVRVKTLHLVDVGKDGATIPLDRHKPLMMGIMDHGRFGPDYPGRFPSSRDWNMPTIKCDRKTCAANYHGECVMPSLIKIGANGKCEGCHDRKKSKRRKKK